MFILVKIYLPRNVIRLVEEIQLLEPSLYQKCDYWENMVA